MMGNVCSTRGKVEQYKMFGVKPAGKRLLENLKLKGGKKKQFRNR